MAIEIGELPVLPPNCAVLEPSALMRVTVFVAMFATKALPSGSRTMSWGSVPVLPPNCAVLEPSALIRVTVPAP